MVNNIKNMKQDLKKTADELMTVKGKVRGEKFRTHAIYIKQREGEEGLQAVEKEMEKIGHPFKFADIRSLDWYSVGLSPIVILIAKDLFQWTNKDIFDMGYSAAKHSFLLKMILKWVISVQKVTKEAPSYWRKNYDFGDIEAIDVDEKNKRVVCRISGFKLHPIMCPYLQGYILKMLQYVIEGDIKIEETKCVHKGEGCEEYLVTW